MLAFGRFEAVQFSVHLSLNSPHRRSPTAEPERVSIKPGILSGIV